MTTITFHKREIKHGVAYPSRELYLGLPYNVFDITKCERGCSHRTRGGCAGLMLLIGLDYTHAYWVHGVDINEYAYWEGRLDMSTLDTKKYLLRVHTTIFKSEIKRGRRKSKQALKSREKIIQLKKELKELLNEEEYRNLTKK